MLSACFYCAVARSRVRLSRPRHLLLVGVIIPRMIIRTLAIKLTILPFTLWSGPAWPKAGSWDFAEKPTSLCFSVSAFLDLWMSQFPVIRTLGKQNAVFQKEV